MLGLAGVEWETVGSAGGPAAIDHQDRRGISEVVAEAASRRGGQEPDGTVGAGRMARLGGLGGVQPEWGAGMKREARYFETQLPSAPLVELRATLIRRAPLLPSLTTIPVEFLFTSGKANR